MKGAKPGLDNVVPMKGDIVRKVPDAPDWMSFEGRKVWEELAGMLVAKERLAPDHHYQFAAYCESVANFIQGTALIATNGMWYEVETRNGRQQKKTAGWALQQEAMNAMRRDSALFGLSPVDDARLGAGGQGDLFDELMKQLKNGTD